MKNRSLFLLPAFLFISNCIFAQTATSDTTNGRPHHHRGEFYIGSSFDAGIFSTATIKTTDAGGNPTNSIGILRFSYVINAGVSFNYNFSRHFGMYSGIDLKNVGFIENYSTGVTVKRRTYNLGAPLGMKFGNLRNKGSYLFLGGGLDVPVNYKEKAFTNRNNKQKFNEWFSDRTPAVMPYVFVGVKFNAGFTLKCQYYTNNYLNPDFTSGGIKPYAGYDVHLILFCLGYDMHYTKHKDMVENSVKTLRTNTL